jgi:chemotaxis protein methyltransferase CheR
VSTPVVTPPPVVVLLQRLVEERFGLRYADADLPALVERVGARSRAAGCASLGEYYGRLREDHPDEWAALADHLVVGETYFFREVPPLEMLVEREILPRIRAGRPVRVWSAGCSTGEEALTMAALLAERHCIDQVALWGTDLSASAVERARRGRHPPSALRVPAVPEVARRWMARAPDGSVDVARELIGRVRWQPVNLLDAGAVRGLGAFDVILCRNVFIYFSERATRTVMANLTESLCPGGVLAVGISESLHRFSPALACEEHEGVFYYRKAAG